MARTSRSRSSIRIDGSTVGWVPRCTAADVDRAVRRPRGSSAGTRCRRGGGPRSSTAPRALLAERDEEFARTIAVEAAKPIKTARVEADARGEHVPVRRRRGPHAGRARWCRSTRATSGEGKLGFILRVPDRRRRRHQPVQLPAEPRRAQARARDRRRLPGRAEARQPDAVLGHRAGRAAARRVRSPAGLAQRRHRRRRRRSATRSSTIPTSRSSPSPARPTSAGASGQRAPRKQVGLELGNNAPVIIEPDGDWKTAAAKIKVAGFSHAGQSCISTQRIYVHAIDPRRLHQPRWPTRSRRWSSAIRSTRRPTSPRSSRPATPTG